MSQRLISQLLFYLDTQMDRSYMRSYLLHGHVSCISALHSPQERNSESRLNPLLPPNCSWCIHRKNIPSLSFCKSNSAFYVCSYACLATWSYQTSWQTSSGLASCSKLLKLDQVAQGFVQSRTSNGIESTASLGSQSQCLVTLTVKKFFPSSSWNIPCCDLCLLPLISLLCTSVWLSLVYNFDSRRLQLNSPVAFSSKDWTNPVVSSL